MVSCYARQSQNRVEVLLADRQPLSPVRGKLQNSFSILALIGPRPRLLIFDSFIANRTIADARSPPKQ